MIGLSLTTNDNPMDTPTDLSIITIKAADNVSFQTTYATIKDDKILCASLKNNLIESSIDSTRIKHRLNHLRNYQCSKQELELASIEDDVKINIGGKVYSVQRQLLTENLEYFRAFFERNSLLHPDYSSIVIDRCYDVFAQVLRYIRKEVFVDSVLLQQDLDFYAYQQTTKDFFSIKPLAYIQFIGEIYKDTEHNLDAKEIDGKNVYEYNNEIPKRLLLWQFKDGPKTRDIEKYCKVVIDGGIFSVIYMQYCGHLHYDEVNDILIFRLDSYIPMDVSFHFSKKIKVDLVRIYEKNNHYDVTPNLKGTSRKNYAFSFGENSKMDHVQVKLSDVLEFDSGTIYKFRQDCFSETIPISDINIWFKKLIICTGHARVQTIHLIKNSQIYFSQDIVNDSDVINMYDLFKNTVKDLVLYIDNDTELRINFKKAYRGSIMLDFDIICKSKMIKN